jgi:hypothetical protein
MATWAQFMEAEPDMAALGLQLLHAHNLAYLGTVRADGAPRLHPVAPFIINGRLYVSTPAESPKARDQLRDGRYVMHLLPGKDDDEFVIRGRVAPVTEPAAKRMLVERGPHWVREDGWIFEYDIEQADTAHWVNVGQPGTYAERRRWRSAAAGPQ